MEMSCSQKQLIALPDTHRFIWLLLLVFLPGRVQERMAVARQAAADITLKVQEGRENCASGRRTDTLPTAVLFELERVGETLPGLTKPFIAYDHPAEKGRCSFSPRVYGSAIGEPQFSGPPLLTANRFYLKGLELSRARSKKRGRVQPVCLLFNDLYEVPLLRRRDGHNMPWDFGLSKGLLEYQAGKYSSAAIYFDLVKDGLGRGVRDMLVGTALFRAGEFAAAEKAFSTVVLNAPADAWGYHNRAITRCQLRKHHLAVQDLTVASGLSPSDGSRFLLARGALYRQLGEYTAAQSDFSTAFAAMGRPPLAPCTDLQDYNNKADPAQEILMRALLTAPAERTEEQLQLLIKEGQVRPWLQSLSSKELQFAFSNFRYLKAEGDLFVPCTVEPTAGDSAAADAAQQLVFCVWSGRVSRRVMQASIHPSLHHDRVRPADVGKYEVVVSELSTGDCFGNLVSAQEYLYVTESSTELLYMSRDLFLETLQQAWLQKYQDTVEFLRGLPCFQGLLSEEQLLSMAMNTERIAFKQGDILMTQNEVANGLYVVRSGTAGAYRTLTPADEWLGGPRAIRVGTVMSGHAVGESTVLCPKGSRYAMTVRCETRSNVVRWDLATIDFRVWTPEICRRLRRMTLDILDDRKLLQKSLDQAKWCSRRDELLVGGKGGMQRSVCSGGGFE